jgi:hypothetical protein
MPHFKKNLELKKTKKLEKGHTQIEVDAVQCCGEKN